MERPLIVVSAIKSYVKDQAGIRCSDRTAQALHDLAKKAIDIALEAAAFDKTETLLHRHFKNIDVVETKG
jgi:predicted transcriptional regulator